MSMMLLPTCFRRWVTIWTSGILAASAIVYLGYQIKIGLDRDDAGHVETPLVLAVAHQLREGPGRLYGPFSGSNPLVLIHAPLYYRLAGLAAWPLTAVGCDPVRASMIAGRSLALLAALGLLAVAYCLARLDVAPRRAGVWSILLIAASPILGSLPVMVRPDTLGVLLQTLGVLLVMKALREGPPRIWALAMAYTAFALAFCTKQHNVFALGVTSALLALAWLRGHARIVPIVVAHAIALAVVVGYFGFEDALTGRMMSESVFVLPGGPFRQINYGSWSHVVKILLAIAKLSVGLITLGTACLWATSRAKAGTRLDAALLIYLGAEVVTLVPLCLYNAGASDNYALQAIVFAGVLVGRALDRVLSATSDPAKLVPIGLAALVLLAADIRLIGVSAGFRRDDDTALRAMFAAPNVAHRRDRRYFVNVQRLNRLYGRIDLAHDEWLYGSYEKAEAAEPRSRWLRSALTTGPVHQVIVPREDVRVEGLKETLPELGYSRVARFGPYRVWERR